MVPDRRTFVNDLRAEGGPKEWILGVKDQPWAEGTDPMALTAGREGPRETDGGTVGKGDLPNYLSCPASGWREHRVIDPPHWRHSKHRLNRSVEMCPALQWGELACSFSHASLCGFGTQLCLPQSRVSSA